jgi:hypothetical protein
MVAEALLLPGDHRTGLDERQGLLPACPEARQPHPEQTIGWTEAWARHRVLIDRELMPQREVFQVQRGSRPEEACNAGQQSGDHREHDQKPPHHGMSEDGGVRCSGMKRNSKKVKRMKSFRFSEWTGRKSWR